MHDDFPRRRAITRGFRCGAPRSLTIAENGATGLFLRSDGPEDPVNHLWRADWSADEPVETKIIDAAALLAGADEDLPPAERARRERLRESSGGITAYSTDRTGGIVAFTLSGRLYVHDVATGSTGSPTDETGLTDARVDPTGRRVAVSRAGALLLVDLDSGTTTHLRTPGNDAETWGSAEFIAAEEMERFAGMWWAPDGERLLATQVDESRVPTWWVSDPVAPERQPVPQRYPAAGTENAVVRLHVMDLDGSSVEVTWDEGYEYLARVHWSEHGDPVIAVQDRSQTTVLTLSVDPGSGSTAELARDTDPRWVELTPGVPRRTERGLLRAAADPDCDTHRLLLDTDTGTVTTPPELQVRSVAADDADGIAFVADGPDHSASDLWRMSWDGSVERLSEPGGWSGGTARAGTVVVARADLGAVGSMLTVTRKGRTHQVSSTAEDPDLTVTPQFLGSGGWSNIAVLMPQQQSGPLPIVMSPYGGPHARRVMRAASAFLTEQWLADQGFCVVVADGPGAPSTPAGEFALHRDLATGPLAGQVAALERVVAEFGDRVDPGRVGIRGWSFGGYLAALAVLERPDLFHAAVAGAPVTEWELYDTHYTERYLGTPQAEPDAYRASGLTHRAAALRRPLLLIHGLSDDNVVVAHTLRLSGALMAAGRPHTVLPLAGVTHMTPQVAVAENLLRLELDFLRTHLS